MAIIKQGGSTGNGGQVMTTMGLRSPRAQVCSRCRERKEGQLYTIDANGGVICADCAGRKGDGVLRDACDPETCACKSTEIDAPDPS